MTTQVQQLLNDIYARQDTIKVLQNDEKTDPQNAMLYDGEILADQLEIIPQEQKALDNPAKKLPQDISDNKGMIVYYQDDASKHPENALSDEGECEAYQDAIKQENLICPTPPHTPA